MSQDMSQLVTEVAHNIKAINIKNVQTDEIIEVKAIKDSQGKVSYENLPDEVEINIYHYTHEERWVNFSDVIMCLLTMHATLGGAQGLGQGSTTDGETAQMLPSEEEYQQLLIDHATFDKSDPSAKYDISSKHKLGIGGFAKVLE